MGYCSVTDSFAVVNTAWMSIILWRLNSQLWLFPQDRLNAQCFWHLLSNGPSHRCTAHFSTTPPFHLCWILYFLLRCASLIGGNAMPCFKLHWDEWNWAGIFPHISTGYLVFFFPSIIDAWILAVLWVIAVCKLFSPPSLFLERCQGKEGLFKCIQKGF